MCNEKPVLIKVPDYVSGLKAKIGGNFEDWSELISGLTLTQYHLVQNSDLKFNPSGKVVFQCTMCNHRFTDSINHFIHGKRCPTCYGEDFMAKPLLDSDGTSLLEASNLSQELQDLGFTLEGEYHGLGHDFMVGHLCEGRNTPHVFKVNLFKQGSGVEGIVCPKCSGKKPNEVSNMIMPKFDKDPLANLGSPTTSIVDKNSKGILTKLSNHSKINDRIEELSDNEKESRLESKLKSKDKKKEESKMKDSGIPNHLQKINDRWLKLEKLDFKILGLELKDTSNSFSCVCLNCKEESEFKFKEIDSNKAKCKTCALNNQEISEGSKLALNNTIDSEVKIIGKEGNLLKLKRDKEIWTQTMDSIILNGFSK